MKSSKVKGLLGMNLAHMSKYDISNQGFVLAEV